MTDDQNKKSAPYVKLDDLSVGYALRWKAVSFIPAIGFNYTKFDVKRLGTEEHKNRGTVYLKLGVTF